MMNASSLPSGRYCWMALACLWSLSGGSLRAAVEYTVQRFPLPIADVKGMNDFGQCAGSTGPGNIRWNGPCQALRIGSDLTWELIGNLGGTNSEARAINNAGQIVGASFYGTNWYEHAFVWTPGKGMIDLGTFGGNNSIAYAINSSGQVVGNADSPDSDPSADPDHAFFYTPGSGLTELGTLGSGWTAALALNDSGVVTGVSSLSLDRCNYCSHAFRWSLRDGMQDLGTLYGYDSSDGKSINRTGTIVGESIGGGHSEATLFESYGVRSLGFLPGGEFSDAWSINDDGVIVGFSDLVTPSGNHVDHGFVWTASRGMKDLNDLVPTGKTIRQGVRINNLGEIVAWRDGDVATEIVLLKPIPARLHIQPTATNLNISWSPEWPGLVLETSQSLAPANWVPCITATTNPAVVPLPNSTRFYRLRKGP